MKRSHPRLLPAALLLVVTSLTAHAQLTSQGVQAAPNYDSFVPPAAGGAYVDPVFGSTIRRVSNALATANADRGGKLSWIENEYSTMSAFNSDNSKFILLHQSYFALYDGSGKYVRDLPFEINALSEPRWARARPDVIYYHSGNQLKSFSTTTGTSTVVHTFTEYSSISGNGEMDISLDGDHFVFAGDNRYIFVYQISADRKFTAMDADGHAFDSLYISPDNHVTVTWLQTGTSRYSGIELFDGDMHFLRQVAHAGGHMDITRDTNGDEVLVWTNSNDAQPIPNCNNGIVKIRLADATQTCLAQLDWSLAVHISAPDGSGSVFVDTEAPANPVPNSNGWAAYTDEILQVKLDGSGVTRLAHHRSRPLSSYNWQPKLSTSRDGSRLLYASNYNLASSQGHTTDYADTYLIVLGSGNAPTIRPGGIGPIFSTNRPIQPGSWISIYGNNLAGATTVWNGDFPTSLGGVTVKINNKPGYLQFVSAGQINLQAPDDIATGEVSLVITNGYGSVSATVTLAQASPSFSLLADGKQVAAAIVTPSGLGAYGAGAYDLAGKAGDFAFSTRPVRKGESLVLFGVGFGPGRTSVTAGAAFSGSSPLTNPVSITIGGVEASVAYAGMTAAGLYQFNVTVPDVAAGDQSVRATLAGIQTIDGPVVRVQ